MGDEFKVNTVKKNLRFYKRQKEVFIAGFPGRSGLTIPIKFGYL